MFKLCVFLAILAIAVAVPAPAPAPAPAPKPGAILATQPVLYNAYPAYSAYNSYYGVAPLPYQPLISSYSALPIVKPVAYTF